MDLVPVNSSSLAEVGYDLWSGVLVIAFRGGRAYQYSRVPRQVFVGLLQAPSHGKFFHAFIRNVYPSRRIQ